MASLTDHVLAIVGPAIIEGEVSSGQILRLEELESTHRVSRTVVRDAIKVLESYHLVASRRRVGIEVLPSSEWDVMAPQIIRWRLDGRHRLAQLQEISELRMGFEPTAAGLASQRATPEQRVSILNAAMGMTAAALSGESEAYLSHDIVFHSTLLRASGNAMIASLAYVVEEVLTGRTHHELMPKTPNPDAVRWHRDVAEATLKGDAATAQTAMTQIVAEAQVGVEQMAGLRPHEG